MPIITLTLAPAFDLHCTADTLAINHENLATLTRCDAGGKGVNISRALHSYGVESTAVLALGDENGNAFLEAITQEGLHALPIRTPGRIRENITVHTANGRETRLSFTPAPAHPSLLPALFRVWEEQCTPGSILTLTGRLPDGISPAVLRDALLAHRARGVRVVIDSRSYSLSDLIEARPFLIKPNEEEIATYTGQAIHTMEEAREAAERIRQCGVANVMISLGGAGAVLACQDGCFTASAPCITPCSTIGAGDSMIAGFIAAAAEGKSPKECLKTAVAFGSAACLTPGTRPPKKEDIVRFLTL